jgi:hypothetical protein
MNHFPRRPDMGEYDEMIIPPEEIRKSRSAMTGLIIGIGVGVLLWALVGFGLFMAVFS